MNDCHFSFGVNVYIYTGMLQKYDKFALLHFIAMLFSASTMNPGLIISNTFVKETVYVKGTGSQFMVFQFLKHA